MKVLLTCPPMLAASDQFLPRFALCGVEVHIPEVTQTLSEDELVGLVPGFDGWIMGDDPATRRVLGAGREGRLRAAVKWGVGVDNVDFEACGELGIQIANTPNMFGAEVADVAMGYVIGLARETFLIDKGVRNGDWPKVRGVSLAGKTVGLIGYGDVGQNAARRLLAANMEIIVYDPAAQPKSDGSAIDIREWPNGLGDCDFIVITCALTPNNHHMLNATTLNCCKRGVRLVNVARGPLIDEQALIEALRNGQVHSAALDVFEAEPLPTDSALRDLPRCIFGSHNASNTEDAVFRTNNKAIEILFDFMKIREPSRP